MNLAFLYNTTNRGATVSSTDWDEVEAERIAKQIVYGRGTVKVGLSNYPNPSSSGWLNIPVHFALISFIRDLFHEGGTPLEAPVRAFMESRFGYNFSRVRIHTNRLAAESAQLLNARAYAFGNHIVFAPQQYAPNTVSGRLLLAHELVHVVQQESRGVRRIQRFEAAVHECIEHYALTRGSKSLSQDEAHAVYFGNWMRDYNQVLVPLVISIGNTSGLLSPFLNYGTLFLLINKLAYTKFRRYLTPEQFGFYIPAEHMDNPAGLVKKHDLLPKQPELSSESLIPRSASAYKKRPQHLDTPQPEVSPTSMVSENQPRLLCNIFAYDHLGIMTFLRRTINVHVEKRLELAVNRGRNPDGMMHLGAALHAVEDLFGHSNWVEIAVDKLLKDEPDLLPELKGTDREVFTFSQKVDLSGQKRPLLTSGSFSSTDTVISLHSELINLLAKGPAPFQTDEERKVDRQFTKNLLKHFSEKFKKDKNFRKAINDTEIGKKTPDFALENLHYFYISLQLLPEPIRKIIHASIELLKMVLMRQFSSWAIAYGVRNSVSDTSLIKSLRDNQRMAKGEISKSQIAEMARQAPLLGKEVSKLIKEKIAEAKDRVYNLQRTPEKIVAGPSHSQLSKDHINSVFFGLSFYVATVAVERLKDKLIAAWEEQSLLYEKSYRFSDEQIATPLREAAKEATIRAEGIIRDGRDIPEASYDLTLFRKRAATKLRTTAKKLDYISSTPMEAADRLNVMRADIKSLLPEELGPHMSNEVINNLLDYSAEVLRQAARISRQVGTKIDDYRALKETAKELRSCAKIIEKAVSHEQREKANELLKKSRNNTLKRLMSTPQLDLLLYSTILLSIDLHITSTAVTYTSKQRQVLEGDRTLPEVKKKKTLNAGKMKLPSVKQKRTALRELIEEVRTILSHPYENDWWVKSVREFVKRNPKQMTWEIKARNEGYPVFKMPTKDEYEAIQKHRHEIQTLK